MKHRHKAYSWWKQKPTRLRKPLVFILGLLMVLVAPLVGAIPGPGGMIVFLAAIAILASEFDWAEAVRAFFVVTIPKEIKNRWRPTPRWQIVFDVFTILLLAGALYALHIKWYAFIASFGITAICLFLFNRERLSRLKAKLKKLKK